MSNRAAILVLPGITAGQQGPVAAWMSTAGWASAMRRVIGAAWIATPEGLFDPDETRRRGSEPTFASDHVASWRRSVPRVVKTALKDLRQWKRGRDFHVEPDGPWDGQSVAFVWQRHELFQIAGIRLARDLNVPSVLFVPATLVWEAQQWGVRRPGWSGLVEHFGERPALLCADLVACGSQLVAQEACRIGVAESRILVTPTGVDLEAFAVRRERDSVPRSDGGSESTRRSSSVGSAASVDSTRSTWPSRPWRR